MDVVKIGTFIKNRRAELNMTQKQLAEKLGCTDKAVSRWETGKGLPDMSFLIPLSRELNISVNELLSGEKLLTDAVDEIKKKNDETLVGVMEESRKAMRSRSNLSVGLFVLLCLQATVFFAVPSIIPNRFGPAETMIVLSVIVSAFTGFCKTKLKWLFPVAIAATFFLINLFRRTEEGFIGFVLSLYFAVGSVVIISVCSFLRYIFGKLRKSK